MTDRETEDVKGNGMKITLPRIPLQWALFALGATLIFFGLAQLVSISAGLMVVGGLTLFAALIQAMSRAL